MTTDLDAKSSGQIFRKDNPMILATNRHHATMLPVRLSYDVDGYKAGQVLARNSVSGLYAKYDSGGASGLDTAKCILFEDAAPESGSTDLARGVFRGEVYQDLLLDLDSGAITDLGARSVVSATGSTILIF